MEVSVIILACAVIISRNKFYTISGAVFRVVLCLHHDISGTGAVIKAEGRVCARSLSQAVPSLHTVPSLFPRHLWLLCLDLLTSSYISSSVCQPSRAPDFRKSVCSPLASPMHLCISLWKHMVPNLTGALLLWTPMFIYYSTVHGLKYNYSQLPTSLKTNIG